MNVYFSLRTLVPLLLLVASPVLAQQNDVELDLSESQVADNTETIEPASEASSILLSVSNPQLRRDLDATYAALAAAEQEEDSFSPILGEHYFAYGGLLFLAGEYEDARSAYASALHIEKVNNGIYGLNQRHILKAIFDTHIAMGEAEKFDDALRRILWIENKNGDFKDDLAYGVMLRAGSAYLDQFLRRPSSSDSARNNLLKAKQYLKYVILRYGDAPLAEKPLPYGELALITLLDSSSLPRVDRDSALTEMRRQNSSDLRRMDMRQFEQKRQPFAEEVFAGGDSELKRYLLKAHAEDNQQEVINALLSLGDMALLSGRTVLAHRYYKQVWLETELLPDPLAARAELGQPVKLPAFSYSMPRSHVPGRHPTKLVPLSFRVLDSGKVTDVLPLANNDENFAIYKDARKAARRVKFRPAIIEGEPIAFNLVSEPIRVKIKEPAEAKK